MRLNSYELTHVCLLWCIVGVCQAWEDHLILEYPDDFFDWNPPPRLDVLEEGGVTNFPFSLPNPLNPHHQTEFSSNLHHDGFTQTTHELTTSSPSGFSGIYKETLAHGGIADSGVILPPASEKIVHPERDLGATFTQQQQHMNWQLSERTSDGNRQLPSSDWLMKNSEWLLLNGVSHLSGEQRQPSPTRRQGFYFPTGSQSAACGARNLPGNHVNRKRPHMKWSAPEGDCPQYYGYSSSVSAVSHPESRMTGRIRSSELPVKFSLTQDSSAPSFRSQSSPVVYSETRSAQTSKSPVLLTRPESAHYSLAPNVDSLSFSTPVIPLGARPVPEVHFGESSTESGSSNQPATLHNQTPRNLSWEDPLKTVGIDCYAASQRQSLRAGAEREIDGSQISDSPGKRIDPISLTFLNFHEVDDDARRKLESELARVSVLESLDFDAEAFHKNEENQGMKEWLRVPIVEKINQESQKKLLLLPNNRAYVDLAKLASLGRGARIERKQFSMVMHGRENYLAAAKALFLKEKAIWYLHWLIHKRIDVQLYLHRLEDYKFVRMEGTFYLFLYYVEMIIAIVPRPRMDGGPINEASELTSACDLFVEFTKTLQSQAVLVGKHGNSKLADTVRSFKKQQITGASVQYNSIIWHFLEEWIKRNRRNIIHPGRTDLGTNVKSFFNDVFCLTIRNLIKRYERLLAFGIVRSI